MRWFATLCALWSLDEPIYDHTPHKVPTLCVLWSLDERIYDHTPHKVMTILDASGD